MMLFGYPKQGDSIGSILLNGNRRSWTCSVPIIPRFQYTNVFVSKGQLEGLSTTTYFQTSKISSNWCQVLITLKHFRELQTPKSHMSFLLGIADL